MSQNLLRKSLAIMGGVAKAIFAPPPVILVPGIYEHDQHGWETIPWDPELAQQEGKQLPESEIMPNQLTVRRSLQQCVCGAIGLREIEKVGAY